MIFVYPKNRCLVVTFTRSTLLTWAKTVKTSAIPPLDIQIFEPFRIQVLPSGASSALVLMEFASEPDAGSVKAKAANCSPDARRGKYFSFCSVVPRIVIPLRLTKLFKTKLSLVDSEKGVE